MDHVPSSEPTPKKRRFLICELCHQHVYTGNFKQHLIGYKGYGPYCVAAKRLYPSGITADQYKDILQKSNDTVSLNLPRRQRAVKSKFLNSPIVTEPKLEPLAEPPSSEIPSSTPVLPSVATAEDQINTTGNVSFETSSCEILNLTNRPSTEPTIKKRRFLVCDLCHQHIYTGNFKQHLMGYKGFGPYCFVAKLLYPSGITVEQYKDILQKSNDTVLFNLPRRRKAIKKGATTAADETETKLEPQPISEIISTTPVILSKTTSSEILSSTPVILPGTIQEDHPANNTTESLAFEMSSCGISRLTDRPSTEPTPKKRRFLICDLCYQHVYTGNFKQHLMGYKGFGPYCVVAKRLYPSGITADQYQDILQKSSDRVPMNGPRRRRALKKKAATTSAEAEPKLEPFDEAPSSDIVSPVIAATTVEPQTSTTDESLAFELSSCEVCGLTDRTVSMLLLPCCYSQRTCMFCIAAAGHKNQIKCIKCSFSIMLPNE